MIIDDAFLDMCVSATYEYGCHDKEFVEKLGFINNPEAGRLFVRGYFAVKWHLGLLGYKQYKWAWETDSLKHQVEVSKTMSHRQFELMMRYFRCVPHARLPTTS